MPTGIYKRVKHWKWSKKSKEKRSRALKKRYALGEKLGFQKGHKIGLGRKAWNKGKKTPLKTRKKMALSQKGRKHSEETKQKMILWHKNKKLSAEHKRKLRGPRPKLSRANNPAWKGGVTPLNELIRRTFEYLEWRKKVFKRDDYTCQECGQRGGDLEAHHKKSFAEYPELRLDVNNGLTLCKECHKLTKKGRGVNTNGLEENRTEANTYLGL